MKNGTNEIGKFNYSSLNYKETISYLFSQLPMYQRIGAAAYKASLETTLKLDEITDYPHRKFKSVHIAGTNGKGSVSHYIAAVLQSAGYKTGLYTSPHIIDFRERIKINGEKIAEKKVVKFVEQFKKDFDIINPSFFEMTVAMAFSYFADEKVDIAVIETGMGGRLDSTNILKPLVTAITNIGLDHTQFLGNSIEEIAIEKAGIIKSKTPLVIGEYTEKTKKVFRKFAADKNSDIYFASDKYSVVRLNTETSHYNLYNLSINKSVYLSELKSGLTGNYQDKNIITSIQLIECLKNKAINITDKNINKGFTNVITLTGIRGRWEIVQIDPMVICDIAHNYEGLKVVIDQLSEFIDVKLHIIIGLVKDKDHSKILELFPKNASYYFTRANIPRSLDEKKLKEISKRFKLKGNHYPDIKSAFRCAIKDIGKNDIIFIGGSTFIVSDFLSFAHIH